MVLFMALTEVLHFIYSLGSCQQKTLLQEQKLRCVDRVLELVSWLDCPSHPGVCGTAALSEHNIATAHARLQQRRSASMQQLSASAHSLRAFMTVGLCLSFAISKQNLLISSLRDRRK